MIVLIKKVLLTGVVTLFASCSAYNGIGWSVDTDVQNNSVTSSTSTTESTTTTTATYQSIDLGVWYLDNGTPTPKHECDSTTHTHELLVTHHEDYDKYVGICTNKETKDFTCEEAHIYHNDLNSSNPESPSHNINNPNSTISSHEPRINNHDPLSDSAIETRRQGIEENQTAQIESHNKPFSTTGRIIYELTIPKGTVLYLGDAKGCTLDSTLILEKTHTIKELITALNSPTIKARFERIKLEFLRRDNPKKGRDHRSKNELQLLDTLISGEQITQILSRIMHPDLNIAQSAFDELKQLWHWKRDHTFLGRDLKTGTGESGFTASIGIDIMKLAEKSLITRPDYIAKHANAQEQKTIQEYKEKCYLLQQRGNTSALFAEKYQLDRCVDENCNKNDLVSNVCLAIADNCWLNPITTILSTIGHIPSLEKAHVELMNLEIQILDQAQKINIIHTNQIKQWTIDHYGFDVLDAAQKCYKSRADYISTSKHQSLFSDNMRTIVNNIEHKDLPSAHAELVHLDKQIDKILEERNITDRIAQKEYIKKSFGKDVSELAHKTYEARADHKKLVESFMAIDVNQSATRILENNNTYESVANEMNDLAKHIFGNARLCNLSNLPKIESHVYDSIDAMRTAQDHPTFIFNFSMVNRTLGDIQQLAHAILSGTHPVLERSSELLTIGLGAFFKGLNPITQISNMGHLASDLGSVLKKGGTALWNDPITTIYNGITTTFTLTELIRNTADFTSDLTVGRLYLSPEEYKQRTDAFCEMMEPLQGVNGDQCADFIGQFVADIMVLNGLSKAYNFLKEIDALGKLSESAAAVTRTFKKGFDTHFANNPIVVTAEGVVIKLSDGMNNISGGGSNNIINSSKALLESAYAKIAVEMNEEAITIKKIYDRTKDGFAEFADIKVTMECKHILGMELDLSKKGKLTIGGFHHDLKNVIEKSDILSFTNKVSYEHDFYKAALFDKGNFVKNATFFPAEWPRDKVISKIYEAYDNFIKNGAIGYIEKGNKYVIRGKIKEGIEIEMYITKNGKIVTAYPILERL